jgi:hypothetical protein
MPRLSPLPADGRVDVRCVAGQQHPADPVALGLPGGVAEPGQPARRVHAEVGARERPQLLLELVEGWLGRTVLGHAVGGHDDAVHPLVPVPDEDDAEPQLGLADFRDDGGNRRRILGHLHVTQQRLDRGGLAGETDAEQLAHRTAAAVAPDEVARAQVRAVRQLDGHPVLVLAQPDHFAAAPDLGTEFEGTLVEQPLGDRLRGGEAVRVSRVQPVRPRLVDAAEETADLELLTDREEPVQQAALVHHLDAAHMQAAPAGPPGRLGQLLEHDRSHPGQPKLVGQHQPGRSTAGNDHVDHHKPPFISAGSGFGWRFCGTTRVLPQAPRCAIP